MPNIDRNNWVGGVLGALCGLGLAWGVTNRVADKATAREACAALRTIPEELLTQAAVTRAYHRAAKTAHPDGAGTEQQMKEINAAMDILRNTHWYQKLGVSPHIRRFSGLTVAGPASREQEHNIFNELELRGLQLGGLGGAAIGGLSRARGLRQMEGSVARRALRLGQALGEGALQGSAYGTIAAAIAAPVLVRLLRNKRERT